MVHTLTTHLAFSIHSAAALVHLPIKVEHPRRAIRPSTKPKILQVEAIARGRVELELVLDGRGAVLLKLRERRAADVRVAVEPEEGPAVEEAAGVGHVVAHAPVLLRAVVGVVEGRPRRGCVGEVLQRAEQGESEDLFGEHFRCSGRVFGVVRMIWMRMRFLMKVMRGMY